MSDNKPEKHRVTLKLPAPLVSKIDSIAIGRGVTRTQEIIDALEVHVETKLGNMCPMCGAKNTADARFCCMCGTPLTDDAKEEIESATAIARASPEYQAMLRALKKDLGMH